MGVTRYGPTEVHSAAESAEEREFLCAISRDYVDESTKLIYADWLEDRGDERAAFLRKFVDLAKDPEAELPAGDQFPTPWLDVVGLRPWKLIRQFHLEEGRSDLEMELNLMNRARPTVYGFRSPAEGSDLPPGCTKYGGLPDLPSGINWPTHEGETFGIQVPVFCAQIRLSDLRLCVASWELPCRGLLSLLFLGWGL